MPNRISSETHFLSEPLVDAIVRQCDHIAEQFSPSPQHDEKLAPSSVDFIPAKNISLLILMMLFVAVLFLIDEKKIKILSILFNQFHNIRSDPNGPY